MKATLAIYGIKDRSNFQHAGFTHDHNLCLMQDGKVLQYLQLERYTRQKHDNRLDLFLEELIASNKLQLPDEFDFVSVNSFVGNAFISQNGKIRFEANRSEKLHNSLEQAFSWFQYPNINNEKINAFNCSQELAHIGACLPFFGEFKENSLLVHFDGGASLGNFSAFYYEKGKLKLLESHWELSHLSKFFNDNALNFNILKVKQSDHCSLAGKLMGYACLGNYDEKIENWLIKNAYFKDYWQQEKAIFQSIQSEFGIKVTHFDASISFFQNVAATFQHIFERTFLQKMSELQSKMQADYLYYSGGCALNIVTNTKLIEKQLFRDIFIPPCCNDSGLSLGAAALREWQKGNTIKIHSPYLNGLPQIESAENSVSEEVIRETANILLKGGIVGICNGLGEIGPRSLGNRSLIALPNSRDLAQKLSMNVKKREWYRPVAPIMLAKAAEKVVENPLHHLAKFMLLDFKIKPEFSEALQGVIHQNGTARIQILGEAEENPFMYRLLDFLYEKHHIWGLINTSFNVQGEPIVHTPEQALKSAFNMSLDAVVINYEVIKITKNEI